MRRPYLEVSFRHGRPFAAYLYLPRRLADRSAYTEGAGEGLLIDYTADGRAIGVEITAPTRLTLDALNHALRTARQEPITADDLAPLTTTA